MTHQLSSVLLRLATFLDELDQDLTDAVLAPGHTSQTGVRKTTINRPAPCNIKQLDQKLDIEAEVIDIMRRAAGDYLPQGKVKQGAASCCRWLATYIEVIDYCDDKEQVIEDIMSMELSLYRMWNREIPSSMGANWLTASQVQARCSRQAASIKPATIRQWAKRKKVRTQAFAGSQCYWWPDIEKQVLRLSRTAV